MPNAGWTVIRIDCDHIEDRRATCTVSLEEGTLPFGLSPDFFMFVESSGGDFGDPRASLLPATRRAINPVNLPIAYPTFGTSACKTMISFHLFLVIRDEFIKTGFKLYIGMTSEAGTHKQVYS